MMGQIRNAYNFFRKLKEGHHLGVDGRMISKRILNKNGEGMGWIQPAEGRFSGGLL
jgi:hypothetical protein